MNPSVTIFDLNDTGITFLIVNLFIYFEEHYAQTNRNNINKT